MTWLMSLSAVVLHAASPIQTTDVRGTPLQPAELIDAEERLVALVTEVDIANPTALYEAQQEGMALAYAVFTFGTSDQRTRVLQAAAATTSSLPRIRDLLATEFLSRSLAPLELAFPWATRLRQRVGRWRFAVDGLPMPRGSVRERRVFPMVEGNGINVLSEVELQYGYLLSTLVRQAAEHPLEAEHPLRAAHDTAFGELADFLLDDKVRFYWREIPAWHWSGPFSDMRDRVRSKLDPLAHRTTSPPWFGAIVDHELHLFAIAADLLAADQASNAVADAEGRALLEEIRASTLDVLRERVTGGADGEGFLIDVGYWSANPSYQYAGCDVLTPVPRTPCPVDDVATDSSHARRWPWWLQSFASSWPAETPEHAFIDSLAVRLAHQFGQYVLYLGPEGRPLTRTFMDGRDGWYRLREFPGHEWGHGPSSLSGSLRYGSWALLTPHRSDLAAAHARFCEVLVSDEPDDIEFRTVYYGSASTRPELAGRGEVDLYGPQSSYALICRVGSAMGLH